MKNRAKKLLKEYVHGYSSKPSDPKGYVGSSRIAANAIKQHAETPDTYSKSSVGMDLREKMLDVKNPNRLLLQLIDDFNTLVFMSPDEYSSLSKELQYKLPQTILMIFLRYYQFL